MDSSAWGQASRLCLQGRASLGLGSCWAWGLAGLGVRPLVCGRPLASNSIASVDVKGPNVRQRGTVSPVDLCGFRPLGARDSAAGICKNSFRVARLRPAYPAARVDPTGPLEAAANHCDYSYASWSAAITCRARCCNDSSPASSPSPLRISVET